jgi:restriction system protein
MEPIELPKFHETFNPILDILRDGKVMLHRELLTKVVDKYYASLPPDLLKIKTKTGDLLILTGLPGQVVS